MSNAIVMSIDVGIKKMGICVSRAKEFHVFYWRLWSVFGERHCHVDTCTKKPLWKIGKQDACFTHAKHEISRKKYTSPKIKNTRLDVLVRKMIGCINQCIQELVDSNITLDKIMIELQLSKNPKMKLISHVIYGKLCETYTCPITFVRANRKFLDKGPSGSSNYLSRKKKSVQVVKQLLTTHQLTDWITFLDTFHASDGIYDLCDALLLNTDLKVLQ